ncbi:L-aspartate oxidase [Pleionea sp. CnH1-48]|uniref:L-aspartate oxidase n=1 Tax=Pleionea sp. CnH1-48 TaxID=2954494 RepID=UPI002096A5E2|nr:L-aspartate oxidase [Pleionea sp. CnH1-48]MCO7225474.1 L-aspartate oxidase [Pleionea sp. CnH1-48]
MSNHQHDVLIIGSGAAGLTAALHLSQYGKVAVLSKAALTEGSTFYAQGGIAAVLDNDDSVESHVQDTLVAGAGLCDEEAVHFTVENSRKAIEWLIEQGVAFSTRENSAGEQEYHLTREGGHSRRRIIHSADATGKAVATTLVGAVKKQQNIQWYEGYNAVDLITSSPSSSGGKRCIGAYALNLTSNEVEVFRARFVILATGGASKVYLYTSNPDVASGDGVAMAWRAGCSVANLEFNQFHPTCLFDPLARSFLISEALRGEGAFLKRADGTRFMPEYDERAELAPRDIVARAIDHEMKKRGQEHVLLDISHKGKTFIQQHFPTIHQRCLELGLDITEQAIPVVPAAHYTCGGVRVDLNSKTDVDGLYAVGEVACTGLHGANRMASNSLLECLVYGYSAAKDIINHWDTPTLTTEVPQWDDSRVSNSDEQIVITHNWHELRQVMWNYVGIVRSDKRLQRAQSRVNLLKQEIHEYYANFKVDNDLLELRNLVLVADLMIKSAQMRKESRGLHYTLDYPELLPEAKDSVLTPQP